MNLSKINQHERDSRIRFDEEPHIYYIDEEAYDISVTKFVHDFFEKFDPDKIIAKFYDYWQSNENSQYFGLSADEIKDMWKQNGMEASKLGTQLHRDIELFYNKQDIENDTKEYNHFKEFHKDNDHLKPYRTEWEVFDEDYRLAGSIDCVFEHEGEYHIFDWKRCKEIKENNKYQEGRYPLNHLPDCNYWHYSLQLNIYKYILEKKYGLNIGMLRLVVLHPDKLTYELVKAVDLQDEVKLMLEERKKVLKK